MGRRGKGVGDMQIKLQPRLHLTVLRNVKPWILSANVQDEVQTIYFIFIYFKTDAVALYYTGFPENKLNFSNQTK